MDPLHETPSPVRPAGWDELDQSPTPEDIPAVRPQLAPVRNPMLEISNAMVRLYKEAFGRGPTKARAFLAGPDTLLVMLEDTMTVAERNLAAMGEHERLSQARSFFQRALEQEFRAIIEQALGRRTVAFVSGIDSKHDLAVEIFTLQPLTDALETERDVLDPDSDGVPPSNGQ